MARFRKSTRPQWVDRIKVLHPAWKVPSSVCGKRSPGETIGFPWYVKSWGFLVWKRKFDQKQSWKRAFRLMAWPWFFFLLWMWDNWYFKSRNRDFSIPYSFRDPYRVISFRIHMDIYTYFIWWFLAHHSILMQIYLLYFNYSSYDFICRCIYVKTKQLLNSNLNKNTDLQTTNYGELGHRNYNINYDITVLNVSFVHMWS